MTPKVVLPSSSMAAHLLELATSIWVVYSRSGKTRRTRRSILATRGISEPKPRSSGPRAGNLQVRWFVVSPIPPGIPREQLDAIARQRFAAFGAVEHVVDQTRHPAMHETHSIDVVCVLQGKIKLILEASETLLEPGQVVIQRGTNHAWEASTAQRCCSRC